MRIFIALTIDGAVAAALAALSKELGRGGGRTVPAHNMHLTLQFIGETDAHKEIIAAILALKGLPRPRLAIRGLSAFSGRDGDTLYADIAGDADKIRLVQRAVADATYNLGFMREKRPFIPHITLLRGAKPAELPAFSTELFECGGVCVYASVLGNGPPIYKKLAELSLTPQT